MAANSQAQNRCVFVGNIPYDASEEQLIQICEEVGPVVSFRLVTDRETGKPKGYGFCEYKDEETALSARRNLQGYDINGRQLRVDFAENGKNAEKNRDQGIVGPAVVSNIDHQKNLGGPAVFVHPSLHQPMGDSVAKAAATVILGALGSGQTSSTSKQTGLGTDPLTLLLAKMSKSQLTEILSTVKAMATENKEQARQLLLSVPSLPRALFQAQVMLGMVSPQMLQMPNIRQASAQPSQPLLQSAQTLPGLPQLPQSRMQLSSLTHAQESQSSTGVSKQYGALEKFATDSQSHRSQLNQAFQQAELLSQSGVSTAPSVYPLSTVGPSLGSRIHMLPPSSSNPKMQVPLPQNVGSIPHINSGYNDRLLSQNAGSRPSTLLHSHISAGGVQPSSSASSTALENSNFKGRDISVPGRTRVASNGIDHNGRASKMVKLNDGRAHPLSQSVSTATPPLPTHSTLGIPGKHASKAEEARKSEKQTNPIQLPPDVDSTLLQQVMNLTPEQLRSLPPDQQQQVIQLQRMLRQAT